MSIDAHAGPIISFGATSASTGQFPMDYNPEAGPSLFFSGAAMLDPRPPFSYEPGQNFGAFIPGWLGFDNITSVNAVPYTLNSAAIVASANPTGPTLALVTANSATTGVAIVPSIVRSDTSATDTNGGLGLVAIDAFASFTATISGGILNVTANAAGPVIPGMTLLSSGGTVTGGNVAGIQVTGILGGNGYVGTYSLSNSAVAATTGTVTAALQSVTANAIAFGSAGTVNLWNPQAMVARVLTYTAAASATYTTATASGYDVYGYPMVESVTLTAGSTVSGKKAFKYVKSVVLSGGTADTTHAYSVGTSDIYGLPIRSDSFGDLLINYSASLNPAVITANTGYVAAATGAQSATSGDVRGTYALQTASATATNRLSVRQSPQAYNVGSITGLYGQSQYANF